MEYTKISINPRYEINKHGCIRRRLYDNKYTDLKGSVHKISGYRVMKMRDLSDEKMKMFSIHKVMAKTFLKDPVDPKFVVTHIDGNKLNNELSNLKYCSFKDSCKHRKIYVTDVKEQDKKKRHNILRKRNRRLPNLKLNKREKGTGTIIRNPNNKYYAKFKHKGKIYRKIITGTYDDADLYLEHVISFANKYI